MRYLVLIFMILLLPLRGWTGDAMATSMATGQAHQQTASRAAATHLHETASRVLSPDVQQTGHAAMAGSDCSNGDTAEVNHAADSHCESCSACQACHTVALSPDTANAPAAFSPVTPPRVAMAQFASAFAALGQKPPIS